MTKKLAKKRSTDLKLVIDSFVVTESRYSNQIWEVIKRVYGIFRALVTLAKQGQNQFAKNHLLHLLQQQFEGYHLQYL